MANHPNRSTSTRQGKALAETIMNAIAGRVGVRINGEIVQSNKAKTKLYVGNDSIPTELLHANLTEHELHELENLPFWTGNNEYQISSTVLCYVSAAIRRFKYMAVGYDISIPLDVQEKELALCMCGREECAHAREKHADRW